MRMQIWIRDDLAKVLNALAWQENRWPKQQAEWLLQKALEQAQHDLPQTQPVEALAYSVEGA